MSGESIENFLRDRKNGRKRHLALPIWSDDFINRLGISTILEGHNGCVNCLEWNKAGTLLVSGSDDLFIRLWRPHQVGRIIDGDSERLPPDAPVSIRNKVRPLASIKTPHRRNIFAAKFFDGEQKIVTGAADFTFNVTDLTTQQVVYSGAFENRIKKIAVVNDHQFFSAVEDGSVQFSDARTKKSISAFSVTSNDGQPRAATVLEIKSIDYHQSQNLLAIGFGSGIVRIFDVRFSANPLNVINERIYFPGHCDRSRSTYSCTHLKFSDNGRELLANLGGEYVYLYDTRNAEITNYELPDLSSAMNDMKPLSEHVSKIKKEGNDLFKEEQYFAAFQKYLDALESSPDHPILLNNSASALMQRKMVGDQYQSFRFCKRALKTHSTYRKARIRAIKLLRKIDLKTAQVESKKMMDFDLLNSTEKEIQDSKKLYDGISKVLSDCPDDDNEIASPWLDYKNRFVGHYNCATDIKEAVFLGSDFIAAGSDCGNLFVWRKSGKLLFIAKGDEDIVNCVQPNPNLSSIATSGIENDIKLWQPVDESVSDSYNTRSTAAGMAEHVEENAANLARQISQDNGLMAHMAANQQLCVSQ